MSFFKKIQMKHIRITLERAVTIPMGCLEMEPGERTYLRRLVIIKYYDLILNQILLFHNSI